MKNAIIPEAFPDSYDRLDEGACRVLVDWLNWCQECANRAADPELKIKYENKIKNIQTVMHQCEVYIEYGWVHHEGEWFLATYDDAVEQEAYLQKMKFIDNVNHYCTKEL